MRLYIGHYGQSSGITVGKSCIYNKLINIVKSIRVLMFF